MGASWGVGIIFLIFFGDFGINKELFCFDILFLLGFSYKSDLLIGLKESFVNYACLSLNGVSLENIFMFFLKTAFKDTIVNRTCNCMHSPFRDLSIGYATL